MKLEKVEIIGDELTILFVVMIQIQIQIILLSHKQEKFILVVGKRAGKGMVK